MQLPTILLVAMVTSQASANGMLMWEMLSRNEKMGEIMYVFMHLVDQTCAFSYIPDCHHVLALHGLSNLINLDEHTLSRLDPQQTGARRLIWGQVMRGVYDLPPAYLPNYYLGIDADEMTNEIDSGFPTSPHHSSPTYLYPYAPIPSPYNKPVEAVSNPHPYSVKVPPPPGFNPSQPTTTPDIGEGEENEVNAVKQKATGFQQGPKQQATEDLYAIWLNGETEQEEQAPTDSETENGEQTTDYRFAGWFDGSATNQQEPTEDIYAAWSNGEATEQQQEPTENRKTTEDRFATWFVIQPTEQRRTEDISTSNSESQEEQNRETVESQSTEEQQEETDRFATWVDGGAGMEAFSGDIYTSTDILALGGSDVAATAPYEPIMAESQVVVSRVTPPSRVAPLSHLAPSSSVHVEGRERRTNDRSSLLMLPLPLLRR